MPLNRSIEPPSQTPAELMDWVAEQLRSERLRQGFTQATLADKSGLSVRTLRDFEAGRGGQFETFVRVLKALGREADLLALLPDDDISPMAMVRSKGKRKRGYR